MIGSKEYRAFSASTPFPGSLHNSNGLFDGWLSMRFTKNLCVLRALCVEYCGRQATTARKTHQLPQLAAFTGFKWFDTFRIKPTSPSFQSAYP